MAKGTVPVVSYVSAPAIEHVQLPGPSSKGCSGGGLARSQRSSAGTPWAVERAADLPLAPSAKAVPSAAADSERTLPSPGIDGNAWPASCDQRSEIVSS